MALQYSPRTITEGLLLCLDPSQNSSYPATDLPVKNGLGLWLDANDDSTFSYSSGTIVSQWRDKSGNNFHASQLTVASQPNRNTIQNSRKTINFDGSNDTVTIPNFSCNSEMSIFVVSNCGTSLFIEHSTDTNSNSGFYLAGQGTGMFAINRSPGIIYITNANWLSGGYSIASGVNSTGLDLLTYKNGTQQSITFDSRASRANSYTTATLYIGSRGANSLWTSGAIAEIIIYNRKVSDRERNLIHTYLGQKWGISNSDRQIFDLSNNNFNFLFNGTNPRYNNKSIVSNFNTTASYEVGSFGGQNLSNDILNLLYTDHTIEVAVNPKGFLRVLDLNAALPYEGAQGIVLWTGRHGGLYFDSNTLYYLMWNASVSTPYLSYNAISFKDRIIYITATRNGNVINLYVNGSLVSGPYDMGTVTPIAYSQINLGCAYQGNPASNAFIWPGQHEFYLVRMYNRQLSATEVSSNYQSFKSRFATNTCKYGLILDIDLSNPYSYAGSGTTIYDVSSTALSWTGSNVTYNSDPIKSFSYNGSNSWLQSSTSTAYDSQTITMECWCYPNTLFQDGFLFEKGQVNTQYSMFIALAGVFYFRTIGGTINNQDLTFTASDYITANAWNHIACTYNGSIKIVYINGVQAASVAASGTLQTGQTNQYIGKYGAATNNFPFNGSIAETRVYNLALTATQVLQNYNATKGRYGL